MGGGGRGGQKRLERPARHDRLARPRLRRFLKPLKVSFTHRGQEFVAQIHAANIETKDGNWISYYPSAREELIEYALRKIALEQQAGFFDQPSYRSGVRFSLWQLRQELIERGHELRYDELVEGLDILSKCSLTIIAAGEAEDPAVNSPILPVLVSVKRKDYDADRSKRWAAQFHSLVTRSIDQIT